MTETQKNTKIQILYQKKSYSMDASRTFLGLLIYYCALTNFKFYLETQINQQQERWQVKDPKMRKRIIFMNITTLKNLDRKENPSYLSDQVIPPSFCFTLCSSHKISEAKLCVALGTTWLPAVKWRYQGQNSQEEELQHRHLILL